MQKIKQKIRIINMRLNNILMGKHRGRILKQAFAITCFLICVTLIIITPTNHPITYWISSLQQLPKAKQYTNLFETNTNRKKLILYWNKFFHSDNMDFGNGSKIFKNCRVSNCLATSNRRLTSIEKFDAIIFHGARYSTYQDGYPENRSDHQKYIFYSMESPYNTNFDYRTINNFYNLTMTYRNDSDIHRPYGLVIPNVTHYALPTLEKIKEKTKKVAWFVSNCASITTNRRFQYVNELKKYIPVDVYGRCGTFTCEDRTFCYQMLERDYKFYLSFENSMCKDYVTEKVFNILNYNVVPVVLGLFSLNGIVPQNSIINTWDFTHPKDLAKFLWRLDENPHEYMKYFEWKKNFTVASSARTKEYALCRICELLNGPVVYSTYDNIKTWFYGFNCAV